MTEPLITPAWLFLDALDDDPSFLAQARAEGRMQVNTHALHEDDLAGLPNADQGRLAPCVGSTLLHVAAAAGSVRFFAELLPACKTVNLRNKAGATPLASAVYSNQVEIAEALLSRPEREELLSFRDKFDHPLIHIAANALYAPIIEKLLEKGASAEQLDSANRPPFYRCIWPKGPSAPDAGVGAMQAFMRHPSWERTRNISLFDSELVGRRRVFDGWLHEAAGAGNLGAMQLLIDDGFAIDQVTRPDGAAPLHAACAYFQSASVRKLIDLGVTLEAYWEGRSPLSTAVNIAASTPMSEQRTLQCIATVTTLLDAGCDPDKADPDGMTPATLAAKQPRILAAFRAYASRKAMQGAILPLPKR